MNQPADIAAEQAILGCVIRDPSALPRCADLTDADWFGGVHRQIWQAMRRLDADGSPIDPVTLESEGVSLSASTDLAGAPGNIASIEHYVGQVRAAAARRRALVIADELRRGALEGDRDPEELIAHTIGQLEGCYSGASEFQAIRDVALEWVRRAEARLQSGESGAIGVESGLPDLDEALAMGGFARGQYTVVGAESSHGKSALLDNSFVLSAALRGQSVCLCSLEDEATSVVARHLSSKTGIQNRALQRLAVPGDRWPSIARAAQQIAATKYHILDVVPASVDQMCLQIRRHIQQHPTDLLGIDYLQFLSSGQRSKSGVEEAEYVIRAITKLARSLTGTATVLLSQYRKKEKGRRPTDDDLRNANAVRYYAHAIIHIWEPPRSDGTWRLLLLTKNKNGPIGDIPVSWSPHTVTYSHATPDVRRVAGGTE